MKFLPERDLEDPVVETHRHYFSWVKPYIKNAKILDVGCWTGPMEQLLKDENCSIIGIDIEEEPLKVVKKCFPRFKFFRKSIIEKEPPFQKNTFDIVLFFMVLEHIPKDTESNALRNINKILKKGGSLFLTTMNSSFFSNLSDPAYFLVGHRHYSKKYLEDLLKKARFKIQEVNYNGGFFTIIYTWVLYFFKHILRSREPRGKLVDMLMKLDYRNKGFTEIHVRAIKIEEV